MHLHFLLYLVAHLALESAASYAECYAPDGSTGYAYLPCVADLNVDSMCCVLNLTALEAFGDTVANLDTCLPNGLCLSNFGQYSRDLCTDKTWQSPNCLNICTGGSDGGNFTTSSVMTQCSDGSWCCGSQNQTDCCDKNLGFKLESSIAPFASSTASATVTLSSATATAMLSNTTSSSSPSESTNSPSSTSANKSLGIGLGVALGVVLLAVVILAFMLYRRHRTQRRRKDQGIAAPDIIVPSFPAGHEVPQPVKIHEVPHFKEPVEMDGSGGTRRANGGSGRPF